MGIWPLASLGKISCSRLRKRSVQMSWQFLLSRENSQKGLALNLIVLNAASTAPFYSCLGGRNDKGTSEGQMDRRSTANGGQTACLGMRFQRVVYQHAWEGQEVQNSIATPHLKSSWRYWPSADPEENAVILYRWIRWTVSMIINVSKPLRQPSCNQLHKPP